MSALINTPLTELNLKGLRELKVSLVDRGTAIVDGAKSEGRDLSPEESAEVDAIFGVGDEGERNYKPGQLTRVNEAISRATKLEAATANLSLGRAGEGIISTPAALTKPVASFKDDEGRPVFVLSKGQRLQDLPTSNPQLAKADIGEAIRWAITGNRRHASDEVHQAMSGTSPAAGGFLIPDEMSRRVVDLARAQSVLMQAGTQTIPMTSDTLKLAKVTADPTFVVAGDNVSITESSITFGQLTFVAHKLATLIKCSRELAEDAPNFAQMVVQVISAALAAKLDNVGFNGVSSSSLAGILDWSTATGIGETGSVGAIAWEDLHAAVLDVQGNNIQPNAWVANPEIAGDLAVLATGDGTNSAKGWLPPPATVAALTPYSTTNIGTESLVVGDFSQAVWALRQGVQIEISNQAGDAFEKHQVFIKCTWRGDFGAFRHNAFHRLVGITT